MLPSSGVRLQNTLFCFLVSAWQGCVLEGRLRSQVVLSQVSGEPGEPGEQTNIMIGADIQLGRAHLPCPEQPK